MTTKLFQQVSAGLMLVIFPLAMMAADTNATLYASGDVTINGAVVAQSSAIFKGDAVRTEKGATAMISDGESTVRLAGDSSVVYDRNSIGLNYGAAVVVTKEGISGRLAGLSVSPASANVTRFGLVNQKGKETIAALEGPLRITDGAAVVELLPGQALTHTSDTATQGGGNNQAGGTEGSTDTPPSNTKGKKSSANSGRRRIPGWGIELMIEGTVGGVLGGLAATGAFDKGSISTSKP